MTDLDRVRLAVSDPGAFLRRGFEDRDGERIYESVSNWSARAVVEAFAAETAEVVAERDEQIARVRAALDQLGRWADNELITDDGFVAQAVHAALRDVRVALDGEEVASHG